MALETGRLQERGFVPKERGTPESSEERKKISGWKD